MYEKRIVERRKKKERKIGLKFIGQNIQFYTNVLHTSIQRSSWHTLKTVSFSFWAKSSSSKFKHTMKPILQDQKKIFFSE